MNKLILKISMGLLITIFSACSHKTTEPHPFIGTEEDSLLIAEETDALSQIPQITDIRKTPNRLTKDCKTYTVTLVTDKPENTEFSLDGKEWRKSGEFENIEGGKYVFYARNTKNNSLQDWKEMYFEPLADVPVPTKEQLNNYLKRIAYYDDNARDDLKKCLGNECSVRGAGNIHNVEQLIIETTNGASFSVTDMEVKNGIVTSITVKAN